MTIFDSVLTHAVSSGASDVYFLESVVPAVKVDGVVSPVPGADTLDSDAMRAILERLLPVRERAVFAERGEANLSHMHPILGRFRVNCYRAMSVSGAVLRRVKTEVPTLESLELPPVLGGLALERQGLILLVGATGAGKSTTVAAMLHHRIIAVSRARRRRSRIRSSSCTPSAQSIVSQREVGIDTESYLVGLRNALRQAPDVIFVGELRDPETVAVALHSAETGHLVMSTLHATNATTAIERVLNFFQPEVRASMLLQLSLTHARRRRSASGSSGRGQGPRGRHGDHAGHAPDPGADPARRARDDPAGDRGRRRTRASRPSTRRYSTCSSARSSARRTPFASPTARTTCGSA